MCQNAVQQGQNRSSVSAPYGYYATLFVFGLLLLLLLHHFVPTAAADGVFHDVGNGLVGYWKFDETASGSIAVDSSGYGNNGTPTGTGGVMTGPLPSTSVPTLHFADPRSLSFDGTDDYVAVPDSASLDNIHDGMTISVWAKTTGSAFQVIASRYSFSLLRGWLFYTNANGTLSFDGRDGVGGRYNTVTSSTTINDNAWHHLIAQHQGAAWRIYIDGVLAGESDTGKLADADINGATTMTIGRYNGGGSYFSGSLDDLRIYNRELSDTEIARLSAGNELDTSSATLPAIPAPITDLAATAGDSQLALSWTAPVSNRTISSYAIDDRPAGSVNWLRYGTSTVSHATVSGIANGRRYDIRVFATNDVGNSLRSNIASATPGSASPVVPVASGATISGNADVGERLIGSYTFWDNNGDTEGTSSYRWLRSDSATGSLAAISGATGRTYVLTSSDLNKYLTFEVTPISVSAPTTGTAARSLVTSKVGALSVVHHVLSTGQSLALGAHGDPPLTTTQPYSNFMLSGSAFISLVEGSSLTLAAGISVESMSSSLANTITALSFGNSFISAVSMHGVGGARYDQLAKGTSAYANGLDQISKGKAAAAALGDDYRVSAITVIHGESDHIIGITADQYESDLAQWQQDYENDAKAITGQTGTIPLFTDQMDAFTPPSMGSSTTSPVPIAQLAAAEDYPGKIVLVGPKYIFPYVDGLHLTNYGYRWLGEYYGKAMKKMFVDGEAWVPLSPSQIVRTGKEITATFHVPVEPLQFDTTRVIATPHYGFEYTDDSGSPPSITDVAIAGPDTVRITLSSVPSGNNERLRYAYTGSGGALQGAQEPGSAKGNLRDSDTTPSLYGNDLFNWAVHFDKPITVAASLLAIPDSPPASPVVSGGHRGSAFVPPPSPFLSYSSSTASSVHPPATAAAPPMAPSQTPTKTNPVVQYAKTRRLKALQRRAAALQKTIDRTKSARTKKRLQNAMKIILKAIDRVLK